MHISYNRQSIQASINKNTSSGSRRQVIWHYLYSYFSLLNNKLDKAFLKNWIEKFLIGLKIQLKNYMILF